MPKKDQNINLRASQEQAEFIRKAAYKSDITVSEYVLYCVIIATPLLEKIPFLLKVEFEDNIDFRRSQ